MEKQNSTKLPLEFQKININKKKENETKIKKQHIEVSFYQSKKVFPEFFFKPISKIIDFNF